MNGILKLESIFGYMPSVANGYNDRHPMQMSSRLVEVHTLYGAGGLCLINHPLHTAFAIEFLWNQFSQSRHIPVCGWYKMGISNCIKPRINQHWTWNIEATPISATNANTMVVSHKCVWHLSRVVDCSAAMLMATTHQMDSLFWIKYNQKIIHNTGHNVQIYSFF